MLRYIKVICIVHDTTITGINGCRRIVSCCSCVSVTRGCWCSWCCGRWARNILKYINENIKCKDSILNFSAIDISIYFEDTLRWFLASTPMSNEWIVFRNLCISYMPSQPRMCCSRPSRNYFFRALFIKLLRLGFPAT